MKEFGRYLSVIITPFHEDLTINYDSMRKVARHMIDGGVEGLIVAATGGESATMKLEERIALTRFMKKEFGNEVPIIVGTGTNNTENSIATTKAIEEAGADGVLLVSPYYNKPNQCAGQNRRIHPTCYRCPPCSSAQHRRYERRCGKHG